MRRTIATPRRGTPAGTGPRRRWIRLGTAAALLTAVGLAGCTTAREPTVSGSIPSDGYRTRHPIVLTESVETLDVAVGTQSGRLTARTASTVSIFGSEAMERGASGVTILVPTGSANEAAAAAMARKIATALVDGGVPAKVIAQQPYRVEPNASDAPIRIAYPRVVAQVPHACGQWPDQLMFDNTNKDYQNFGCAYQANLAAMVANPTDLVTPQGTTPADATRRTTVMTKYRAGEETKSGITAPNSTLADVGGGGGQ